MKNNRMLLILGIIVFLSLGWYQIFNTPAQKAQEYQEALRTARDYMAEESYEYAVEAYSDVKKIQDSIELRSETAAAYRACVKAESPTYGDVQYRRFLMKIKGDYPTEALGYELLFDYYYEKGQIAKCLEVLTDADGRHVRSESLVNDYETIRYASKLLSTRYDDFMPNCGGMWMVRGSNGWSYIDNNANLIIDSSYDYAAPFGQDIAYVVSNEVGKLIDKNGNTRKMVPEIYEETGFYEEGLMPVCVRGQYSYINMDFETVMGPYSYAGSFSSGVAAVKEGGIWRIIDAAGAVLADGLQDVKLDKLGRCAPAGVIVANDGSGYRLYDSEMNTLSDPWEDADVCFGSDVAVFDGEHWGFIDTSGKPVIECGFADARSFSGGVAAVKRNDMWGFIDSDGEMIVDNEYDDAAYFDNAGLGFVKQGEYWYVIIFVCNAVNTNGGLFT